MKKLLPQPPEEILARKICQALHDAGYIAYLAGGCVRDMLLGTTPKDYDIATNATVDNVQRCFDRTEPVGEAFGVCLVILEGIPFEVATFRKDGPYLDGRRPSSVEFCDAEEDAKRRDFTINALFLEPQNDTVLDYVNGQQDLQTGIVRTVGEPEQRFQEDYLRLLRAVRFSVRLGFPLDDATQSAISPLAANIQQISAERIGEEIAQILTGPHPDQAIALMDDTGLLEVILPEVKAMQGVEQPPEYHPEGDVYVHTLLLLKQLDRPTLSLAMATLLHDVGKPTTQTFEDRIRFNNHDKIGAEIARQICQRFRFSNKVTDQVVCLVDQHMRLGAMPNMKEAKRKRFVREPYFDELLALCLMDCMASHEDISTIAWILDYLSTLEPDQVRPERFISGQDLIQMGYAPSPQFKAILTTLEDEQLSGNINTQEEAIRYIQDHWPLSK